MARNPAAKPNPARIADEQARFFQMKLRGMSVRAIAAETGIPRSTVENRLTAAYAALVLPLADEVRKMELERLDAWLLRLEQRLDDGEDPVRVVPVALKVSERRAKLTGADSPIQVDATVTETTQADLELQDMIRAAKAATAVDESNLRGAA